tara:strand:- start:364 stop:600 length:237 start_codon:yes stop_codon:yes gene_type:complete
MNIQERASEIVKLYKKLKDLNLGIMGFDEIEEFRKICNKFIKDGKKSQGKIPINGIQRIICYNFDKRVDCYLKYDENI